jgi:hypothetical protein
VCDGEGSPAGVTEALGMLHRALDHLNAADAASLPSDVQAEALRALERAEGKHTAARARVLGAFAAQGGFEDDGHGTARTWLKWQTRVTQAAAAGVVAWVRRLAAHPAIADGLAAGELSRSWARQICEWTERLPDDNRADADEILVAAARGGASLASLGGLAREMYERCAPPDDRDDGFDDRFFRLGITFRGAGRAEGDLTPACAAALAAVLEALGKKAGPEDVRTGAQRRHDALEEACRRLIRSGMLPGRNGQPTQILLHMTLAQLRDLPGASAAEGAWAAARAAQPGWATGPEAEAAACDATVIPLVTGHVDWTALDQLTEFFLAITDPAACSRAASSSAGTGRDPVGASAGGPLWATPADTAGGPHPASKAGNIRAGYRDHRPGGPQAAALTPATRDRLRRALLGLAAGALSGPDGLAARLRAALDGTPLTTVSLPLDIGAAAETIPAHLRRAVTARHPHCAFPGCDQPATACDIHHLIPRARGGPTAIHNLVPLCTFHHQIAVHRWGWVLRLNNDGTTTATSPDRTRILHSHGPPSQAA